MRKNGCLFAVIFCMLLASCSVKDTVEKKISVQGTQKTEENTSAYSQTLTDEDKSEAKALIADYFTDVTAVREADDDDPLYSNEGIEGEYAPGNIIIYYVMTETIKENGNPEMKISIARENEASPWKIVNQGY